MRSACFVSLFLSIWSFALKAPAQTASSGSSGRRAAASFVDAKSELDIIRIGDATHLEFNNAANWSYRVDREGADKIRVRLPKLSAAVVQKLKALKDNLVTVLAVDDKAIDETTEILVKLASADVDYFEYTTSEPAKLIIDFFPKSPDLTPKKAVVAKPLRKKLVATTKKSIEIVEGATRVPAGDYIANPENFQDRMIKAEVKYGLFDGGDPEFRRFSIADYEISEKSILASRDNIYISFPMIDFESTTLEALIAAEPVYDIIPKDGNDENEEARLLLVLFKNKRNAVFLQQAKDYMEKYPESPYEEIVRYMMADTHYRMWLSGRDPLDFEAAMGLYRSLTERFPDSPLRNRTLLLMGYSFVDRGDSFTALTTFQRFNRLDPNSRYHDQVQLAIAQSYLKLGRYEDADRLLTELEKEGKTENVRWEAAFRKGDIFFKKKDFNRALAEYDAATKRYGKASKLFPSAYYNSAEAKFQLKDYKESLMSYLEFLKAFPSHNHGGYALTRVGELLDILGAPKKRVMGAYLESIFRFRNHPGAGLARLRFLTGRFPDLKQKELEPALTEIDKLTKQMTELPDFQDVNELTTLVVSDGLTRRGDYSKAGQLLVQKYQQNPQSSSRDKYLKRITHNITQEIKSSVDKADFIEALRVYSKNQGSWLKANDRIDTDYLTGLAYEQAGAYGEARKVYDKTYQKIALIKGTDAEKEHLVYEQLPTLPQLSLRLAAMDIQIKDYRSASENLQRIREEELKSFTPKEFAERADISSQIFEQKGDIQKAVAYLKELLAIWKEGKGASLPLRLRYARLLSQQGDAKSLAEAETALAQISELKDLGEAVEEDLFGQALELRGEVAIKRGERKEAIGYFSKLLEDFESKRPLASIRYRLGRMQFDEGWLNDAENTWKKLSATKDGVWKRLASEQMSSEKWRTEYKRYIDRIPAANSMGKKQ